MAADSQDLVFHNASTDRDRDPTGRLAREGVPQGTTPGMAGGNAYILLVRRRSSYARA
jgi:hypothetical protein